jgi:hypothetical protein
LAPSTCSVSVGGGRNVGFEDVALDERRPAGNPTVGRDLTRQGNEPGIQLDADSSGTVLLRRDHDDPSIARAEIVDHVVGGHFREAQHAVDDWLPGGSEERIRRALRHRLRSGLPNQKRQYCRCNAAHGNLVIG